MVHCQLDLADEEDSDFGELEMTITRPMKRKIVDDDDDEHNDDDDDDEDDNDVSSDSDSVTTSKRPRSSHDIAEQIEDDLQSDRESLSSSATSIASLRPESMEHEVSVTIGTTNHFASSDANLEAAIADNEDSDDDTAAETDDALPSTSGVTRSPDLSKNLGQGLVETTAGSLSNDSPSGDTNQEAATLAQAADDAVGPPNDGTAMEIEAGPSTSDGRRRRKNWKPSNEESIKQRLRPRAACVQQEPRTRIKRPNRRFAQRTEIDPLERLPTMEWSLMGIPLPENFDGPNHPFWDEAFPPTRPRVIPIEVPRIVKKWKVQPGDLIINDDGTVRYRRTRRRQSAKNNSSPMDASPNDANDQPSTSGHVAPTNAESVDDTPIEENHQDQGEQQVQAEKKYVPFTGEWSLMEVAYAGRIVRYKTMPDRSVMALVKKLES